MQSPTIRASLSALSLLAAAGALPLLRGEEARPNSVPGNETAPREFTQLDANEDGRISPSEFMGARPEKRRWWRADPRAAGEATEKDAARPEMFTALDRNRDGFLSPEELANGQMLQNVRGRLNRDGREGNASLNQHPEIKQSPGSNTADPSAERDSQRDK